MSRRICIALVCLALGWASNVNRVAAQPYEKPAKTDKMVRVTYPIADLVVPIQDHTAFSDGKPDKEGREITKDTMAAELMKRITDSVARETWETNGGKASIQYFPMGIALVVHQSEDVQREIVRLLTELRRLQDMQVSMELRCIQVSAETAKQFRAVMDARGQPVRARNIEKPAHVGRFVSVDDMQVWAILELAQTDRAAKILQAPKLTVYNGQQACINSLADNGGVRCDVWPVIAADKNSVRFSLHLELAQRGKKALTTTEAIGTFTVPADRSLLWHVGETQGQHLFVMATPRVLIIEEEESIFLGNIAPIPGRGEAEEQSAPEPKKPADQPSAKERAIQYRLKQPISLNFKDTPLREAIQTISIQSGIQVVPDVRAFQEAKINMDAPLSGTADNIAMKSALNILLKPMRLSWIIEDEVLKITTEDRTISTPIRRTYKVADLVDPLPTVEGQASPKTHEAGEDLKALIANIIARNSWEDMGGTGSIQYFPLEKALVITHSQEIHEEIQLLLATLRKLQDLTVNVDVRFVHASAEASPRLLNEMGQEDAKRSVVMDDASIQRFLEAAKGQTIVPAPKINVHNGQTLAMSCVQKQIAATEFRTQVNEPTVVAAVKSMAPTMRRDGLEEKSMILSQNEKTVSGWRYCVQPVVSPDRKSVRLNLNFEHFANEDAIERTTKAAAVFVVPDQRTLVWHLGATTGGQHLFVLVTPRVIVREEEAAIFLGNIAPIPGR